MFLRKMEGNENATLPAHLTGDKEQYEKKVDYKILFQSILYI